MLAVSVDVFWLGLTGLCGFACVLLFCCFGLLTCCGDFGWNSAVVLRLLDLV